MVFGAQELIKSNLYGTSEHIGIAESHRCCGSLNGGRQQRLICIQQESAFFVL